MGDGGSLTPTVSPLLLEKFLWKKQQVNTYHKVMLLVVTHTTKVTKAVLSGGGGEEDLFLGFMWMCGGLQSIPLRK